MTRSPTSARSRDDVRTLYNRNAEVLKKGVVALSKEVVCALKMPREPGEPATKASRKEVGGLSSQRTCSKRATAHLAFGARTRAEVHSTLDSRLDGSKIFPRFKAQASQGRSNHPEDSAMSVAMSSQPHRRRRLTRACITGKKVGLACLIGRALLQADMTPYAAVNCPRRDLSEAITALMVAAAGRKRRGLTQSIAAPNSRIPQPGPAWKEAAAAGA